MRSLETRVAYPGAVSQLSSSRVIMMKIFVVAVYILSATSAKLVIYLPTLHKEQFFFAKKRTTNVSSAQHTYMKNMLFTIRMRLLQNIV